MSAKEEEEEEVEEEEEEEEVEEEEEEVEEVEEEEPLSLAPAVPDDDPAIPPPSFAPGTVAVSVIVDEVVVELKALLPRSQPLFLLLLRLRPVVAL